MKYTKITKQAANEFILEFDKQAIAHELKEGDEFKHEGIQHKIVRFYPGMTLPGCYTFLVITRTRDQQAR